MENKQKNSFLITWVFCIVILLVLCFFGVSDSLKGTLAAQTCVRYACQSGGTLEGTTCKVTQTETVCTHGSSYSCSGSSNCCSNDGGTTISCEYVPSSGVHNCSCTKGGACHEQAVGSYTYAATCTKWESDDTQTTTCPTGQYSSVPNGMVCGSFSNECYSNCHTSADKVTGPTCGGSGNGWTLTSCVKYGNVWDNTSGCCEPVKVTEQEASSSKKTEHSNKSYTVTIKKADGSIIKYNYNKDGKLMSVITTDSNGNQSLDTTENSNLNGSIINYYNNLEECNYMVSDVNSYCVPYKGTYVTVTQARTKMTYKTEEECKQTTGLECEYRTYPDDPQKGYFMSVECDCEENGDCLDDPEPKPGNPDKPTIKDPVDDIPTVTPEPGNPDVDDPKPEDRGEGCYKNKDTGEFKWFEKDPELNSKTKLYERVNDSNCKHNITENPQTGEIAMFFIWIIAFGAVGYSVWYYMKSRKES